MPQPIADTQSTPVAAATTRGDLEALHRDSLGWALTCCSGDRDLAEETLQHTYLKVLDGGARFGDRSSFKTWLFGVVRRTATEVRRRRAWGRLLPFGEDATATLVDPRPSGEADLLLSEDVADLRRALGRLGQRQRQVLHLVFYQELTIEEAAGVLGIGLGTARTHYQRGKARLRRLLEEERS